MHRWLRGAVGAAFALAIAGPAPAFLYHSGTNGGNSGDLVAVWVKNGYELILDLGPIESLGLGHLASFSLPDEFDGDLIGAKFTALAVPFHNMVYAGHPEFDPPLYQPNIGLTTLGDPATISPTAVGDAQSVLDAAGADSAQDWYFLLGTVPPAGQPGVVENGDTRLVIQTSLFASYTGFVGFNSDNIGGRVNVSTATTVAEGDGYAIPLYEVFQTLSGQDPDYVFGSQVTPLGQLAGDDGSSGNAMISLQEVPEPGALALGAVAVAALAGMKRRRS